MLGLDGIYGSGGVGVTLPARSMDKRAMDATSVCGLLYFLTICIVFCPLAEDDELAIYDDLIGNW